MRDHSGLQEQHCVWHLLPPHCKAPLLGSVIPSHFQAQVLNSKSTNVLFQQIQISHFFPQEQQSNNRTWNIARKKSRYSMLWKWHFYIEGVCNRNGADNKENNGKRTDRSCTRKHYLDTGHRWGPKGLSQGRVTDLKLGTHPKLHLEFAFWNMARKKQSWKHPVISCGWGL